MIIGPYYVLPEKNGFKGSLLDDYLAAGYYRMLHTVFTTHFTQLQATGDELPVFWLRSNVNNIPENKTTQAIRKKCGAFTVACKKAAITPYIEELYSLYSASVDFSTAATCYACMHDSSIDDPFDSRMIEIRDKGRLVAVGYFDLGKNAITGILNFYHPAYKKYSPGKYLMLQKTDWARANDISWYYTGYIGIGTEKFDYKLFPDTAAIEVFLPVEKQWIPYEQIGKEGLAAYWQRYLQTSN